MNINTMSGQPCPKCDGTLTVVEGDAEVLQCAECGGRFTALIDPAHDVGALVDLGEAKRVHPLWLPRGSIRALVTIALSGVAWAQVLQGRDIPPFLLGLLLTLIGYYFGVRREVRGNDSGIYDVDPSPERPLFLPSGSIRLLLMLGFLVSGVLLLLRGAMEDKVYLEFFLVIAGLVVGHLFRRGLARLDGALAFNLVRHGKALAVIAVTAGVVYLVQQELHQSYYPLPIGLSALVSFYFGSRS